MKIVTYDEFVKMPAGTVFAIYELGEHPTEFAIKEDTGCVNSGRQQGYSFNGVMPLNPLFSRIEDGCVVFPDGVGTYETEMAVCDEDSNDYCNCKLFAILEEHEVKEMIRVLQWALDGCHWD